MFERFIKNEVTLKKWRLFKSHKLAMVSIWGLLIATFFSYTAEFWANSKPIVLSYNEKIYFPVIKNYTAKEFGQLDTVAVNYRELELDEGDWAIWPVIRWDPYESNEEVDEYPSAPTAENLMGTDDRGRDVFTRLLYGLRYSISFAVLVWLITFSVGTLFGGYMGYKGGRFDLYSQRFVEILSTVPQFFLLIILIGIFQPSMFLLILIFSIFGWIPISYYMRGEFLKNRKLDYVESARAIGARAPTIFYKHILLNSLGPIITFSPFVIAANISGLASLDYLGFGLMPPTPSWGEMLAQAQKNFTIAWWLAFFPSMALFVTLTKFTIIGEAVREVMDPRNN